MTYDQIINLVTGVSQAGIFAALFIWLFLETRKESAKLLGWFQLKVEQFQENERKNIDSMRELSSTIRDFKAQQDTMLRLLEKIEDRLDGREAVRRGQ